MPGGIGLLLLVGAANLCQAQWAMQVIGNSYRVDFTSNSGSSPAGWAASTEFEQFASSMTQVPPAGGLDSDIWRAGGLHGNCTLPASVERDGNCGRLFHESVSSEGPWALGRRSALDVKVRGELAYLSGKMFGGVCSWDDNATYRGSLGMLPLPRNDPVEADLSPGYIDIKLTHGTVQKISGLNVRYTIESSNFQAGYTKMQLQYTGHGGEDWYFRNVPDVQEYITTDACGSTCDGTWGNRQVVNVEMLDLNWRFGNMYFRWYVDTVKNTAGSYGDALRILDLEFVPFVVEYDSAWAVSDKSLLIQATDENYISVEDSSGNAFVVSENHEYTFEAWLRPASYAQPLGTRTMDMVIVSGWDNQHESLELGWTITTDWSIACQQNHVTEYTLYKSNGKITPDQWNHVGLVLWNDNGGDRLRIYINGILTDHTPHLELLGRWGGHHFRIGQWSSITQTNASHFLGRMDEVRMWDYPRTADQIASSLDLPLKGDESGLTFYFKMDSIVSGGIPNMKVGSPWLGLLRGTQQSYSILSNMSALTLSTLTGGSVTCDEKFTVPRGEVVCNMTILTQRGVPVYFTSVPDTFAIRVIHGPGQLGSINIDPVSGMWSFKYFADERQTGTALIQAYHKGDPFAGRPYKLHTIEEGCRACEWRERTASGDEIYSCVVDGRRFLRRNITKVPGVCDLPF